MLVRPVRLVTIAPVVFEESERFFEEDSLCGWRISVC